MWCLRCLVRAAALVMELQRLEVAGGEGSAALGGPGLGVQRGESAATGAAALLRTETVEQPSTTLHSLTDLQHLPSNLASNCLKRKRNRVGRGPQSRLVAGQRSFRDRVKVGWPTPSGCWSIYESPPLEADPGCGRGAEHVVTVLMILKCVDLYAPLDSRAARGGNGGRGYNGGGRGSLVGLRLRDHWYQQPHEASCVKLAPEGRYYGRYR